MLKNLRKITSLLLVLTLVVLVFGSTSANAASIGVSSDKKAQSVVYQAVGSSISADMRKSLSSYDIPVKADTKLEIVKAKGKEGTILYVTNREGALVTKAAMMTVTEDGSLKSFTENDVAAAATDIIGVGATDNPFNDGLQIIFTVAFKAYWRNLAPYGIIQPQMAMFRYVDPNNLYTISKLVMSYDCYGHNCPFDGTDVDTNSSSVIYDYKHSVIVSQTNPVRDAYYSASNPIANNRAMLMTGGGSLHEIAYTLQGVRNSTGKQFKITDYEMVDPDS